MPCDDAGDSVEMATPLVPIAATDATSVPEEKREWVYRRRRPAHPARFLAFTKQAFGPLEQEEQELQSTDRLPAESDSRGGLLRALCRRRQEPKDVSEKLEDSTGMHCTPCKNQRLPLVPLQPSVGFGPCVVTRGRGRVWFAGSDDREAEWHFNATGSGDSRRHALRCGPPWASPEDGGAGERCIEISLQLEISPPVDTEGSVEEGMQLPISAEERRQAFDFAEARLRTELEKCLLTRSEAALIEAGDPHISNELEVAQWEAIRAGMFDGASTVRWSPTLSIFQAILSLVSAMPGSKSLAAIGEAVEARARQMLENAGHQAIDQTIRLD